jgi:hypothetical protein
MASILPVLALLISAVSAEEETQAQTANLLPKFM